MKKILVSLPDGVVEILDKDVIGKIGEGYSDTLRTIIMNWLGEQGYLTKSGKSEEHQVSNVEDRDARANKFLSNIEAEDKERKKHAK